MIGRRRIGKTSLLLKSAEGSELKPLGKFLQFFAVELMNREVLLNEFAFLADKCSTRYASKVYHSLKLLPLISCYVNVFALDVVLRHPLLSRRLLVFGGDI